MVDYFRYYASVCAGVSAALPEHHPRRRLGRAQRAQLLRGLRAEDLRALGRGAPLRVRHAALLPRAARRLAGQDAEDETRRNRVKLEDKWEARYLLIQKLFRYLHSPTLFLSSAESLLFDLFNTI